MDSFLANFDMEHTDFMQCPLELVHNFFSFVVVACVTDHPKVDGSKCYCFQEATFYDMKHATSMRWFANAKGGCIHFPHNFCSTYEYFIQHQSEDFCARQTVINIPPNYIDY